MAVAGKYNKYSVVPPAARVSLRQFAIAVHETDGVAADCVSLQDRFGLDVNVLLLAAYVGAVVDRTLTADEVAAARALVDAWHGEVVRPLRTVRRLLKTGPAPAPNARTEEVRGKVAKAEIDAELVELDVLGDWAAQWDTPPEAGHSTERVGAALAVVVRSYSEDALREDDRRALTAIAEASVRYQKETP